MTNHYDRIVSLLYDAVLDDRAWPRICDLVGTATGVRGIHLAIIDQASVDPNLVFSHLYVDGRPAPEMEEWYVRDYFAIDERVPRVSQLPVAKLVHNDSLFTDRERKASAVYNDFLKKVNGTNQVLINLPGPDRSSSDIWVLTRYNGNAWDADQTGLIERVVPHMGRFLRLRRALAHAEAVDRSLARMLEDLNAGVILLDRRGRVMECNARARGFLNAGDVLAVDDGALRPLCDGDDGAFGKALAQALPGDTPTGGSVRLTSNPDAADRHHLMVHIIPVTTEQPDFGAERPAVLLLLIDPWSLSAPDASRVAEALGLTEFEARVASLLAQGRTVREIAVRIHRTEHTVRYHLKQAFAKTGVRRQAELVRLVLAAGAA